MYKLYKVDEMLVYTNINLSELYAFNTKEEYYKFQKIVDNEWSGYVNDCVKSIDKLLYKEHLLIYQGSDKIELFKAAWRALSDNVYKLYRNGYRFFVYTCEGIYLWDNRISLHDNMRELLKGDKFIVSQELLTYLVDNGFRHVRDVHYTGDVDFILELKKGMR